MKTLYDILELSEDETQEKIKSQYLLLINAWHPDKFRNPEQKKYAEEKTKEINEAYEVLKDSGKRAVYDRKLSYEEAINSDNKKSQSTAASHAESTATPKYERKKEESTSKQKSSTYDSPADEYVTCWNCSATNRNDETYCQKCGVALDEKFNQQDSIFILLKIFSFLVVIFLIIILFNSIFNNPSSKTNNTPISVASAPYPTKVPTKAPTKVPTKNPNLLFSDDFSVRKPSSESFDDYADMWYGDDESFYIKIKKPTTSSGQVIPVAASDVIVKTNAQQISDSNDGYYGVVCRDSDTSHYFFLIDVNGFYGIGKYINGESKNLISGKDSAFIRGGVLNTIVVECIRSKLSLSVNGKLMAEVMDNSIKTGNVALVAGAGSSGENTVKFLDVQVTKPISGTKPTRTPVSKSRAPLTYTLQNSTLSDILTADYPDNEPPTNRAYMASQDIEYSGNLPPKVASVNLAFEWYKESTPFLNYEYTKIFTGMSGEYFYFINIKDDPVLLEDGWCAIDKPTVEENVKYIIPLIEIDGQKMSFENFAYYDSIDEVEIEGLGTQQAYCKNIFIGLYDWNRGKHIIKFQMEFSGDIFDGWDTYTRGYKMTSTYYIVKD